MRVREALFIGGPWDGKRQHVNVDERTMDVPVLPAPRLVAEADFSTQSVPALKMFTYILHTYRTERAEFYFLHPEDRDATNVMDRLVAFYRPNAVSE